MGDILPEGCCTSIDHPIAIIGMGAVFPASNGLKAYWRLIFNGEDSITDIPENSHWRLKDYFDENPDAPDHTYCKRGGFIPEINFDPAEYGFPPNNLEATDTSQLLGLMVAKMALADAGYPTNPNSPCSLPNNQGQSLNFSNSVSGSGSDPQKNNPLNRTANHLRTSVILGVTGTQELVIPLGARLYNPVWKKALHESGITGRQNEEIIQRISEGFPKWQENSFPGLLGNVVAGRIANRLNLGGTNTVVDAACASSLSAINTACLELASGRCDLSISGGVDTLNDIFMHICFSKTGVLSHTSDAKPFSKDADGTVLGEGIGMVVLKRLEDAERDNNRIYAVIRGIGTSSDGKTGGIYAPDAGGQLRALKTAYKRAGIDPCTVELFEAHGTGTRVGDRIEFTALKSLFSNTDKNTHKENTADNTCGDIKNLAAVGSVKSMIGHAKAAAGAAGLIKSVLSLYHKVIPPTLKAENPDPEIDITNSSFYLNSISKPWVKSHGYPRRCGVSAFGFGGSNFHIVLEEYREKKEHVSWDGTVQIAAFSANTKEKLKENIIKFKESVDPSQKSLSQKLDSGEKAQMVAWKTSRSRKKFSASDLHRLLIVITDQDDPAEKAAEALLYLDRSDDIPRTSGITSKNNKEQDKSGIFYGETDKKRPEKEKSNCKIAFLFPGQGSQYTGMGRELISMFPEALETLELADKSFSDSYLNGCSEPKSNSRLKINSETNLKPKSKPRHISLKNYLYPPPLYAQDEKTSEEKLRSTDIAQPAIGAVSLAMAKILARFGVRPDATCGHSFGELTALCAAEWIDDATFFNLASARGRYMADAAIQGDDPGTMFAVKASLEEIEQLIKSENFDLVIANINSPNQVVLSGSTDEIKKAAKICKSRKLRGVQLAVAAAFHSRLVENAVEPFKKTVSSIDINCSDELNSCQTSRIKVFSNTTGKAYPEEKEQIKTLLGEQLINPVRFMSDIESMIENDITTFIEVGPKTVLTGLVRSILESVQANHDADLGGINVLKSDNKYIYVSDIKDIDCFAMDSSAGKKRAIEDLAYLLCSLAASGVEIRLDRWESPVEEPAKKMMRIPLTGANVKLKPQKILSSTQKRVATIPESPIQDIKNRCCPQPEIIDIKKRYSSQPKGTDMKNRYISQPRETDVKPYKTVENRDIADTHWSAPVLSENQQSPFIYSAMQMVQKGMESMQELQTRTALAHEKFLDTQAAASRTLQAMMEQTRFFAENAIYSFSNNHNYHINHPLHHAATAPAAPVESHSPAVAVIPPSPQMTPIKVDDSTKLEKKNGKNNTAVNLHSNTVLHHQHQNQHHQDEPMHDNISSAVHHIQPDTMCHKESHIQIESTLLETVSKLTGFPVEMLTLDMDIESDLGIDSIKRVEIVSELEKSLPGADALTPENMGTLKTLKDICDALTPVTQNVPEFEQKVPATYIPPVSATYIPEHRYVEHSSVEDRTVKNKVSSAQTAGTAHQTASVVLTRTEHVQLPARQTQSVMEILMETISFLTGFPVEMLAPDMDIESDLGIDSIKRVEILSKLEEKLPEAQQISPDDLGRLKTIEQIAKHISGNKTEKMECEETFSCETVTCQKKNF